MLKNIYKNKPMDLDKKTSCEERLNKLFQLGKRIIMQIII